MFTVDEVAQKLGVAKGTMQQWISKKTDCGPYFKKIGGRPVMFEEDFDRYIKELPYVGEVKK